MSDIQSEVRLQRRKDEAILKFKGWKRYEKNLYASFWIDPLCGAVHIFSEAWHIQKAREKSVKEIMES